MAIAKVKKVQLIILKSAQEKTIKALQNSGVFQIIEAKEDIKDTNTSNSELHRIELDYANINYAISLLSQYDTKKRGLLDGPLEMTEKEVNEKMKDIDYKKTVEECLQIEETMTQAKNDITKTSAESKMYKPWNKLKINLQNTKGTKNAKIAIGSVKKENFEELITKISALSQLTAIEKIDETKTSTLFLTTYSKELEIDLRETLNSYKFIDAELPKTEGTVKEYLHKLETQEKETKKVLHTAEKELTRLSKTVDDLKIAHDYTLWKKDRIESLRKLGTTNETSVITGWLIKDKEDKLEKELQEATDTYAIIGVATEENEIPPVILKNGEFISSFESVTMVYGLPQYTELDPTPFLSAYFIVFFALCLTDAGYGIIMFIVMYLAQKKLKLPIGMKKLVKVLMYGGLATFVIGALFGGWFGLTPDQIPESLKSTLLYTTDSGSTMFRFQKISATESPVSVLILSLILGYTEILMGVTMKFVHDLKTGDKKDAWLDTGTWIFMLVGIGFTIVANTVLKTDTAMIIGKWWTITGALVLVVTQGREKKGIIGKLFSGTLSLYGLVGYLSDILSYSRLLALGLATAIIGLAVNTVVGLVTGVPYVGWLLGAVIFLGGHTFNLLINSLGAFIHSGRLQFVEFFTKFMEGGGKDFKPLNKKTKYLFIK